jgi:hypothetical protein
MAKTPVKEPEHMQMSSLSHLTPELLAVKALLDAQPKVRIRLTPDRPGEPKQGDKTVQINGYTYLIKRGEWAEVPESVAEILSQGGHI